MKNPLKFIPYLAVLLTVTLFVSCSSDDDVPTLDVADFNVTVDENQSENTELGTVGATGTDGVFTYSITAQSPAGSIAIDAATGKITVADASSFDFETNPSITATISVTGNSITTTASAIITLNDIDDLAFLLSDSQAAYAAAADGDWVLITETEYNLLASSLNEVTKVATSDSDYNSSEPTGNGSPNFTVANNNGLTMPNNSYVFAFKYTVQNNSSTTNKVKQSSTSISDGYADLGGLLPAGVVGDNYLVLKASNTPTTDIGYLAIYYGSSIGFKFIGGDSYNYATGDTNQLTNISSATFLYQGLSTTQKQW
tara:strand:+ start:267263 stop:268201 length:939 start_codon:yes stop_codon:yes gene_type:complete